MPEVKPIPEGYEGITPHLVVDGAAQAIEFYKKAFGAEEIRRALAPGGSKIMHAEIKIGDSMIFLVDEFPEFGGPARSPTALGASSVSLHRYVEDTDAAMQRAVAAGAKVKMEAMDTFWGDRYGIVTDPFGHEWTFSTHIRDVTPEEMEKASQEYFSGGK